MPMRNAQYFAVMYTDCSALSGFLAPRFCPTNVAAALLNPHTGNRKKIKFRIASW